MHEFWAEPLQVAVASWLLQKRVGVSFVIPIGITLGEYILNATVA